ncbi:hypothetical protein ACOME3_001544 [Neoechinorhynchus agilis]
MSDDLNERKLFVRRVPLDCESQDLDKVFSEFGELEDCTVKTSADRNRKFAFILFKNSEDVKAALDANPHTVLNTKIFVSLSKKPDERRNNRNDRGSERSRRCDDSDIVSNVVDEGENWDDSLMNSGFRDVTSPRPDIKKESTPQLRRQAKRCDSSLNSSERYCRLKESPKSSRHDARRKRNPPLETHKKFTDFEHRKIYRSDEGRKFLITNADDPKAVVFAASGHVSELLALGQEDISKLENCRSVAPGDVVLEFDDGVYFRVEVLSLLQDDFCQVHFMDVGGKSKVKTNTLKKMNQRWKDVDYYTQTIAVVGTDSLHFQPDDLANFKRMTEDKEFKLTYLSPDRKHFDGILNNGKKLSEVIQSTMTERTKGKYIVSPKSSRRVLNPSTASDSTNEASPPESDQCQSSNSSLDSHHFPNRTNRRSRSRELTPIHSRQNSSVMRESIRQPRTNSRNRDEYYDSSRLNINEHLFSRMNGRTRTRNEVEVLRQMAILNHKHIAGLREALESALDFQRAIEDLMNA